MAIVDTIDRIRLKTLKIEQRKHFFYRVCNMMFLYYVRRIVSQHLADDVDVTLVKVRGSTQGAPASRVVHFHAATGVRRTPNQPDWRT